MAIFMEEILLENMKHHNINKVCDLYLQIYKEDL